MATGFQWVLGAWERPPDAPKDWQVPAAEVNAPLERTKNHRVALIPKLRFAGSGERIRRVRLSLKRGKLRVRMDVEKM